MRGDRTERLLTALVIALVVGQAGLMLWSLLR